MSVPFALTTINCGSGGQGCNIDWLVTSSWRPKLWRLVMVVDRLVSDVHGAGGLGDSTCCNDVRIRRGEPPGLTSSESQRRAHTTFVAACAVVATHRFCHDLMTAGAVRSSHVQPLGTRKQACQNQLWPTVITHSQCIQSRLGSGTGTCSCRE